MYECVRVCVVENMTEWMGEREREREKEKERDGVFPSGEKVGHATKEVFQKEI